MAVLEVYDHAELAKILQAKFFLSNESNYTDEAYYQSASELSVARYIKQKEKQKLVTGGITWWRIAAVRRIWPPGSKRTAVVPRSNHRRPIASNASFARPLTPTKSVSVSDPGRASVKSLRQEMIKLDLIRRLELPPDLFDHRPTQELVS
jgi:hypothetical protein